MDATSGAGRGSGDVGAVGNVENSIGCGREKACLYKAPRVPAVEPGGAVRGCRVVHRSRGRRSGVQPLQRSVPLNEARFRSSCGHVPGWVHGAGKERLYVAKTREGRAEGTLKMAEKRGKRDSKDNKYCRNDSENDKNNG